MSRDASLQKYRDFYEKNVVMGEVADECFKKVRKVLLGAGLLANNTDPAEDLVDAIVKYIVISNVSAEGQKEIAA